MKQYCFEEIPLTVPESLTEMRELFSRLLTERQRTVISFINPEIFLAQQTDSALHDYFAHTQYNFIDGIGLLCAINKKCGTHYGTESRFPGTDFFSYLPPGRSVSVYLYGSRIEHLEEAKERIERQFPSVQIAEWTFGYTKFDGDFLVQKINAARPDILIVCKGCPLQEQWIAENKSKLNVPLVFGNGGAVDFWSGAAKRAPSFVIRHGFEWLWRLFASFSLKRLQRQLRLVRFAVNARCGKYDVREIVQADL
ncbi:MAG: WecB/TagA/CpsF family glycosyltransferase [Treponemataceae bacterium]|nr:WecB/TagA/CpsF family glycosyltransferase [Treponemataceae bacterium]